MSKAEDLLVQAGMAIAHYQLENPNDQLLHEISQRIFKYFAENQKEGLVAESATTEVVSSKMERPFNRLTDKEIQEILGPFAGDPIRGYTRKLFDEIQDKLEEKNK